ncbi:MAG: O-antigen ligase family protein [Syntrophaceae bacterium]|nr:O-antigen ligase family protein [Syntrophaceae bacterium]
MAFLFYLLYVTSYFLRFGERMPVLGSIRFDLILVLLTTASIILLKEKDAEFRLDRSGVFLLGLLLYIVASLPFVQWPGSVLRFGLENYFKVIVFYFFTVMTVTRESRLKTFIMVFVACQVFRVLEPMYLHWTTGYWGDNAFMGDGEIMNRLAGSPYDVINPNGLAYVAVTVIAYLYHLCPLLPGALKVVGYAALPVMVYALVLTGSRSGMIALAGVAAVIILTSRRKAILLVAAGIVAVFTFQNLGEMQQERYLSIYRDDVRGASTAQGRIDGIVRDIEVAMNSPIFGHGLGTSLEANYNIGGTVFRSHNLVMEVWQEIGLIGLLIFFSFVATGIRDLMRALKRIGQEADKTLLGLAKGVRAWLVLNLIFGVFSYGLSSYSWYLFVGLSSVLMRLSERQEKEARNGAFPA